MLSEYKPQPLNVLKSYIILHELQETLFEMRSQLDPQKERKPKPCLPEVQNAVLERSEGEEEMTDSRVCVYLHSVPGQGTVPAVRPYAYCYAYEVSECPTQEWKITEKCWRVNEL